MCVPSHTCCVQAPRLASLPIPAQPPASHPLRSFEDLIVTIDALLVEGEEPTMAPPPPLVSGGPCKQAADMAAAAAALSSAPPGTTPN